MAEELSSGQDTSRGELFVTPVPVSARAGLGFALGAPIWSTSKGRRPPLDPSGTGDTTTLPMPSPIGIAVPRKSGGFAPPSRRLHAIDTVAERS